VLLKQLPKHLKYILILSGRNLLLKDIENVKRGGEDERGMRKGMNSTTKYLRYCKNFCDCHNVFPPSTTIKKDNKKKMEKECKHIFYFT
jgi:hypothetical protein